MPPRVLAGLLLVLACSPPAAPQPGPEKAAAAPSEPSAEPPAEPSAEPAKPADAKPPPQRTFTAEELDKIGPRPAPVPPLTQEEIDILAADPVTLSREDRVKQAQARRRRALQNPDSPTARRIERMRQQMERGEFPTPTLPQKSKEPIMSLPDEPAKAP